MKTASKTNNVNLVEAVGGGYGAFWRFKGRFRVCKGSRASKKSKTTALNTIVRMMQYPLANTLVVRKTYRSLHDSCFSELKWAIHRLKVDDWWSIKESPLEMTYKPTGQKILFRGLDDPLKVTSITVNVGVLCWLWIEEAYEIEREADFDMINESIRGAVPDGYFKQVTITLNPWSDTHWIKARFFDDPDTNTLAMTTNYTCNEWLDDADKRLFEQMRINNPRRYAVAGLGEWGVSDGLVYENWTIENFNVSNICDTDEWKYRHIFGLDYGYTNDPTAFIAAVVNPTDKLLYIYDEFYETRLLNSAIAERITSMGYTKERIVADSAEPKSNDDLRRMGLRIADSVKGADSIRAGINYIQEYRIIVHPKCKNTIAELSTYAWAKDKQGKATDKPIDSDNHLMDALRYAMQSAVTFRPAPPTKRRRTTQGTALANDMKGGWT